MIRVKIRDLVGFGSWMSATIWSKDPNFKPIVCKWRWRPYYSTGEFNAISFLTNVGKSKTIRVCYYHDDEVVIDPNPICVNPIRLCPLMTYFEFDKFSNKIGKSFIYKLHKKHKE